MIDPRVHARTLTTVVLACLWLGLSMPGCKVRDDADEASATPRVEVTDLSRIVTLGGATTEVVYALGHGDAVVGVDASSGYPPAVESVERLSYYRMVGAESVLALDPTVVFALEGTNPNAVEGLSKAGVAVVTVPHGETMETARERIELIARTLEVEDEGRALVEQLDRELTASKQTVESCRGESEAPSVLFVYARGGRAQLVMGNDTGADTMIELAGARNAADALDGAKPITAEAVVEAAPDVILLPEGSFESLGGEAGLRELPGIAQAMAQREVRVETMDDAELLSFGPRVGAAVGKLARKLHACPQ